MWKDWRTSGLCRLEARKGDVALQPFSCSCARTCHLVRKRIWHCANSVSNSRAVRSPDCNWAGFTSQSLELADPINGPLFRSFLRWFANDFHPVGMSQRKSQGPNAERVFRLPHKLSGSSHFPLRNGCPRGCFGLLQSLGCAQTTARWERTSNSQWTLGPCYVSLTPGVLLEIQSL